MLFSTLVTTLALATAANAIKVTAPSNSTGWTSSGAQVIEWDVSVFSSLLDTVLSSLSPPLLLSTSWTPRRGSVYEGSGLTVSSYSSTDLRWPSSLLYTALSPPTSTPLLIPPTHSAYPNRLDSLTNTPRQSAQTPQISLSN